MNDSQIRNIQRLQHDAMAQGFRWDDARQALEKVREECDEIQDELNDETSDRLHEEVGDLLLASLSLASTLSIDADDALNQSFDRFKDRWKRFQNLTKQEGISITEMNSQELHDRWCEVKRES